MKEKFRVRTEERTVEFQYRNYSRMATIKSPEESDDVFRVEPLWTTSINDILLIPTIWDSGEKLDLRWFDSEAAYNDSENMYRTQKSGTRELRIKIYYTSVQLDRQDKLESLGV